MTAMSMLMESYMGKSKELIQCENYMKEIIDDIYKEYDSGVLGPKLSSKRQITRNFDACKKWRSY